MQWRITEGIKTHANGLSDWNRNGRRLFSGRRTCEAQEKVASSMCCCTINQNWYILYIHFRKLFNLIKMAFCDNKRLILWPTLGDQALHYFSCLRAKFIVLIFSHIATKLPQTALTRCQRPDSFSLGELFGKVLRTRVNSINGRPKGKTFVGPTRSNCSTPVLVLCQIR